MRTAEDATGGRPRASRGVFVYPVRSLGGIVSYTKEEEQRRRAEIEPPVERTVEDAVLSYHPVRTFEKREVPEEKLLKILSLAQRAPSEWGVQPWRWLILRQRDQREKVFACTTGSPAILSAPLVLVACANTREWIEAKDTFKGRVEAGRMTQDEYDEAVAELDRLCGGDAAGQGGREFALRNTMMALTAFMLVAQGEGLATGPMGGFDEAALQKAFDLPQEWAIAAVCALGYPDEEFDRTLRKPLGDIVHWDKHGGTRLQGLGTGS
jgi:nitroreductase